MTDKRTTNLLTIRCPEDLQKAIEQRMQATGQSKTDVVVHLLKQALGLAKDVEELKPGVTLDERITAVVDERTEFITRETNELVQQVQQQLDSVKQEVQQSVKLMQDKLSSLEKQLA